MSDQSIPRTRARGAAPSGDVVAAERGPVWVAFLFFASLLIPYYIKLGPVLLMPHRIVLITFFVPFFLKLYVMRRCGPVISADWLMLGSALWVAPALMTHYPFAQVIAPFGIHFLEFFGAYVLARVTIRSGEDFRRMVGVFFLVLLLLLPFAALESITRRPVLIDLIPGIDIRPVNAGIRLNMRRAQTIFAHPILFGTFASTGFGLFWYALRPRGMRFPGVIVAVMNTIFSLSTGALLSIVAQTAFVTWEAIMKTTRNRWRLFAILSATGYIVIDLISNRSPFHVLVSYATFSSGSAYNRILIWRYGSDNVWANPFFGLGFNDWERPNWMGASVDNFWLLMAMRYGLPMILMMIAALFIILRRVSLAKLVTEGDQLARAGYLTAFGGIVLAGGTVHYWHAMMAFVAFIFGSGVWAATGGAARVPDTSETAETPPERRSAYTRQTVGGGAIEGIRRTRPGRPQPVARASRRVSATTSSKS